MTKSKGAKTAALFIMIAALVILLISLYNNIKNDRLIKIVDGYDFVDSLYIVYDDGKIVSSPAGDDITRFKNTLELGTLRKTKEIDLHGMEKIAKVGFCVDGELLFEEKLYTDAEGKLYAVLSGGLYYEPDLNSSEFMDMLTLGIDEFVS